ncbi:cytochrome c oxidase accessory protein CcoG [Undibacterium sp.]|uniref:cytochrome c oxidase accessory protein CcoG n=1 Tax=Undibacterium sp. TaxID=1914977 RepID=UPI002BC36288|nr:cytochrome c oxidase accessory protein CcoG [Undibacterium sp.]HTD03633.1 cytochrome c oxidase accessory protein CcoG [Undibacterium sp.]
MSEAQPQYATIKMYASREEIYPREVKGLFANWRWACVWITQLVFYGLPWLSWNGRQAVLFDLTTRKFYLFGIVLWPQDFIYLTALLIICAYSLFLFTAVAGRLWCGFACPQTVYSEIFMWVERKVEGSRSARIRLDRQGWTLEKAGKKTAKHAIWLGIALWTGISFVGYFTPIHTLMQEILLVTLGPWEWFWVLFYALATYGNAGWMREQVCKYMCPYARFQSVMFDQDTLIITYDERRGEPRNAKNSKNPAAGACIDCSMCVQVCPTGIDIRNGLQYECIACAACIDACDTVMDKIAAPRGLIRYSTANAIKQHLSQQQVKRAIFRPRVLIYSGLLLLITGIFFGALLTRIPLKLDVIRDRGSMGREVGDGVIENVYRLQVMNTDEISHRYNIKVSGLGSIQLETPDQIELAGATTRAIPVRVHVAPNHGKVGSNPIWFELQAEDRQDLHVKEKAVFFVPRP